MPLRLKPIAALLLLAMASTAQSFSKWPYSRSRAPPLRYRNWHEVVPIVASLARPKELAGEEHKYPCPAWLKTRFGVQTSARAAVKGSDGKRTVAVGSTDIAPVAFRPKVMHAIRTANERMLSRMGIDWRAMTIYLMIPVLGMLAGELFVWLCNLFVWFFSPLIFAADLTVPVFLGLAGEMFDWLRESFVWSFSVSSVIAAGTLQLVTGLASAYSLTRWLKTKEGARWKLDWDYYYIRQVR